MKATDYARRILHESIFYVNTILVLKKSIKIDISNILNDIRI